MPYSIIQEDGLDDVMYMVLESDPSNGVNAKSFAFVKIEGSSDPAQLPVI